MSSKKRFTLDAKNTPFSNVKFFDTTLLIVWYLFSSFFHDLDPPTPVVGGFRFINSGATVSRQGFFSPLNIINSSL